MKGTKNGTNYNNYSNNSYYNNIFNNEDECKRIRKNCTKFRTK